MKMDQSFYDKVDIQSKKLDRFNQLDGGDLNQNKSEQNKNILSKKFVLIENPININYLQQNIM
jgi:hypothetical protein